MSAKSYCFHFIGKLSGHPELSTKFYGFLMSRNFSEHTVTIDRKGGELFVALFSSVINLSYTTTKQNMFYMKTSVLIWVNDENDFIFNIL